jgi:hypothetical protein
MKRKIKNIILKGITALMAMLFFISLGVTEITWLSGSLLFVSLTWILLFALANNGLFE